MRGAYEGGCMRECRRGVHEGGCMRECRRGVYERVYERSV
jgi:hypothetical protein